MHWLLRTTALLSITLAAIPAAAQTPGACVLGTSERDLDVNDVRARAFNTGSLF